MRIENIFASPFVFRIVFLVTLFSFRFGSIPAKKLIKTGVSAVFLKIPEIFLSEINNLWVELVPVKVSNDEEQHSFESIKTIKNLCIDYPPFAARLIPKDMNSRL